MAKEKRSNKWAFLLYQESAPEHYLDVLENMHIPFVLSPWHDKDINKETGEFKKTHKHGALYFDSLKSYSQVSELLTKNLNTPAHVEPVMSPKGMTTSLMQKILKRLCTISIKLKLVAALS